MASRKQCDNCRVIDNGSPEGRVTEHELSVGYARYKCELCLQCVKTVTITRFTEIGRRVGTGHLRGCEMVDALPFAGEA